MPSERRSKPPRVAQALRQAVPVRPSRLPQPSPVPPPEGGSPCVFCPCLRPGLVLRQSPCETLTYFGGRWHEAGRLGRCVRLFFDSLCVVVNCSSERIPVALGTLMSLFPMLIRATTESFNCDFSVMEHNTRLFCSSTECLGAHADVHSNNSIKNTL